MPRSTRLMYVRSFNPSLLPEATPEIEVGFFGLATQSNIYLKPRPAGVDVPTSVYNTVVPGGSNVIRPLATADLPNPRSNTDADNNAIYAAAIGMVRPLAGKALVFGFYAFLPVRAFLDQNGFFADEREQYFSNKLHFELLGDRLDVSTFTFALGSQLNEWLSIGAGIDVAILTQSKVAVYVPDGSDQSRVLLAPDINTDSKFKPYFAATVHPTRRVPSSRRCILPLPTTPMAKTICVSGTTPIHRGRTRSSRRTPSRRGANRCASPSAAATAAPFAPTVVRLGKLASSYWANAGRSTTTGRASIRSTPGTTPLASRSAAASCGANDMSPPTSAIHRRRYPIKPERP